MNIYEELVKNASNLKKSKEEEYCGMDAFLSSEKIKIASLGDLSDFFRVAEDTLVHKAKKDLWRISEDEKGQTVIERLFDPSTNKPIKV